MAAYACAVPLANGEAMGDPRSPLEALAGTVVKVKDSAGVERTAPLLYVAPGQVNYVIPPGTARGNATVTIVSAGGAVSTATTRIDAVAPGFFTYTASHIRYAAAQLVRVRDGVQTMEPLVRVIDGRLEPAPIDIGPPSDEVHLVLFGTGWRGRTALANVKVNIGGVELPVQFAGPQGVYAGLDQLNVKLSGTLAQSLRGALGVAVMIDGKWTDPDESVLVFRDQR